MRTIQRNRRELWYALYKGVQDVTDSAGNLTGEQEVSYETPVQAKMNISGGRGRAAIEEFGIENPFTHTAVTGDMDTPFDTDTIWWFGKAPTDGAHNFRCTGVSRTVNQVVIALAEVDAETPPVISG